MFWKKKEKWIFLVICLVVVFSIYGRTLWGGFVFDDRNIVEHQASLSFSKLPLVLAMPYWSDESGLYRPTVVLSYALNFSILGAKPWGFHLINLILYALCGWWLWLLIRRLFSNNLLAYVTALLFLALSIHTEAVANIVGRAEILALGFSLLALYELAKEKGDSFLIGFYFLLAMGSKETAIAVLPLAVFVVWIKEKKLFKKKIFQQYCWPALALISSGVFYFLLRFFVLGRQYFLHVDTTIVENQLKFVPYLERLGTSLAIFWSIYLKKTFWPFDFCSDYSFSQIEIVKNFFNYQTLSGLAVVLFLIVGSFVFLKRWPALALGCAFVFFGFLPVANWLLPIGTIAGERLAFFPSVGFCLIVAQLLIFLSRIKIRKRRLFFEIIFLIIFLVLVGFYGWRSFVRNSDWLTEKKLFTSAAQCAPNSVLSRSNIGAYYYMDGDIANAKKEFLAAEKIYDSYPQGVNNLGLIYWKEGDRVRAREYFSRALSFRFPFYGAYENLSLMALEDGKIDEARDLLTKFYSGSQETADAYIQAFLGQNRAK